MEKPIKFALEMVDKFIPGYKTYVMMGLAAGMCVCQMMGYHQFTAEAWGLVGIMGGVTWKLGLDRK